MNMLLKSIGLYLRVLELFSTKWAIKKAFDLFQRPRTRKIRPQEQRFYERTTAQKIQTIDGVVMFYEIGDAKGKPLFLVHGWESNAASMAAIGTALANKGFHVVSFDTPAHGQSEETRTNLQTMSNHMLAVIEHFKPAQRFSVIAHSFGSIISAHALAGKNYSVDQLIYLTAPIDLPSIFEEYRGMLNLSQSVYEGIINIAEGILKQPLSDITTLKKTQQINYQKLTLIHDRFDKMLPFSNSETLSRKLSRSELHPFEKIGHYRMLWNEQVISTIMSQLAQSSYATPKQPSQNVHGH